jgi:hypothetical protein
MKSNISKEKQLLLDKLELLEAQKIEVVNQLNEINRNPNNFIFEDLDEAEDCLMDMFRGQANDDCSRSYIFGEETYSQEFIIDGHHFIGTGTFEYNINNDNKCYYVDGQEWNYELLGNDIL